MVGGTWFVTCAMVPACDGTSLLYSAAFATMPPWTMHWQECLLQGCTSELRLFAAVYAHSCLLYSVALEPEQLVNVMGSLLDTVQSSFH